MNGLGHLARRYRRLYLGSLCDDYLQHQEELDEIMRQRELDREERERAEEAIAEEENV